MAESKTSVHSRPSLKLAFDAVKRGANHFIVSAYSQGKLAAELEVRLVPRSHGAVLLPYPKVPFTVKKGFEGSGAGKALIAYAVGFARSQDATRVVFANFTSEKVAQALAGPGRVQAYHEFRYSRDPQRFQIIWD